MKPVLAFDMDGVLVDVTESYRETIRHTVRAMGNVEISKEQIQEYKNAGGWNNDWALSQKILSDHGVTASYDAVVEQFQKIMFGGSLDHPSPSGLVYQERWMPEGQLLEKLSEQYDLTIFTGRTHKEALFTLDRFSKDVPWSMIVGDDDVVNSKPAPDGLLAIAQRFSESEIIYVGDTVDDARAARLANVRFIGVASADNPLQGEVKELLKADGAQAVIENINQLGSVL